MCKKAYEVDEPSATPEPLKKRGDFSLQHFEGRPYPSEQQRPTIGREDATVSEGRLEEG